MTRKKKLANTKNPPVSKGPYLALAVICENTLEDKDGVMSLIRVVDTFKVSAMTTTGESLPREALSYIPPTIVFQVVVGFKAGNAKGQRRLTMRSKTPMGQVVGETTLTISFDIPNEPRGALVRAMTSLTVKEEGIYWIDVLLNQVFVTRIPLRVVFEKPERGSIGSTQRPGS